MFFNNLQKNQPAANVDQQSTIQSTPESTLCVELSDEELCAVNGGSLLIGGAIGGFGVISTPIVIVGGGFHASGVAVVH